MPFKFKVGERVKVARVIGSEEEKHYVKHRVGCVGIIKSRGNKARYTYIVKFTDKAEGMFAVNELEAAPAKAKKKGK